MGACSSSSNSAGADDPRSKAEKERNRQLELQMHQQHTTDLTVNKLLLLGAGESGKSTLFKQMINIYGQGFPEAERKAFIPIIFNNILSSIKTLCTQSDHFSPMPKDSPLYLSKQFVELELKGDEEIDVKLAQHLSALWADPNIQLTYAQRAQFQLTDSASYFFSRLTDIAQPSYVPTEQDVLRSRVRTTGIVENEFTIDGSHFKMFDVGGQRNERKKWIHCFENVTAVLFVAALSEYDQVLYEDENTNRITEALNLFDEICNSRWFRETSIILFLNKRDLFAEKLHAQPLAQYFGDYHGDNSYDSATLFMRKLFEDKNKSPDKAVYSHITCATDTENVHAVFNSVKDIIIRKSLNEAGLV